MQPGFDLAMQQRRCLQCNVVFGTIVDIRRELGHGRWCRRLYATRSHGIANLRCTRRHPFSSRSSIVHGESGTLHIKHGASVIQTNVYGRMQLKFCDRDNSGAPGTGRPGDDWRIERSTRNSGRSFDNRIRPWGWWLATACWGPRVLLKRLPLVSCQRSKAMHIHRWGVGQKLNRPCL